MSEKGAVSAELSASKRALLELRLRHKRDQRGSAQPAIPARRPGAAAPLTATQRQLWFLHRLQPGLSAYNMPVAYRLRGSLDTAAVRGAAADLVERHESLRVSFVEIDGEPMQVAHAAASWTVQSHDLSGLDLARREDEARRLIDEDARRPFDLASGAVFRVQLLALDSEDHVLQLNAHHIVCDGWSMSVLLRELSALYHARMTAGAAALEPVALQFPDYATWQGEDAAATSRRRDTDYVAAQLRGAPFELALPLDGVRPARPSGRGQRQFLTLAPALVDSVRRFCARSGATLFMTSLAAFAVLLRRYSGQHELVVGSPLSGRSRAETTQAVGFFANTLPWRLDLSGDPTLAEVIDRIRLQTAMMHDHERASLEGIVETLKCPRDASRTPLFQVAFALYGEAIEPAFDGVAATAVDIDLQTAKFDLTIELIDGRDGLRCALETARDLFTEATGARLLEHFAAVLAGIGADPQQEVATVALLSEAERERLLVEWNATDVTIAPQLVHEMVEAQAARRPHATAVGHDDLVLDFGTLDRRANQLAHHLHRRGVGRDVLVALWLDRSPEMVVAMLAVLKAGGAYLPLDPAWPVDRLAFVLQDAAPAVVLTSTAKRARLPESAATVCVLDADWSVIAGESESTPASLATADDIAYVIYTSGSTGQPKGVLIPHAGFSNLVQWHVRNFAIEDADRASQVAALGFDACVWEIWPYLAAGASVHLADASRLSSGSALWTWLAARRITRAFLPTALGELVLREPVPATLALRTLLVGGDRLQQRPPAGLPFALVNNYGPTEASVVTTSGPVDAARARGHAPTIGRPIANTRVYVLDVDGQPVPIGVVGELHIAGRGLARGYLRRPELTAEKFVVDPFATAPGAVMYKTGDLVRYCEDGEIEFVGRGDDQVKIRGFRIELREIEVLLGQHPAVAACAVVACEGEPGQKRLVAYVTLQSGAAATPAELRRHLESKLPPYMVPASVVVLEALPMSANGKIDRRALQDRPLPAAPVSSRPAEHGTEVEQQVAAIWREELNLSHVGLHDNFFDLGGHSLLVLRVQARLQGVLGRDVAVVDLFEYPTVASLSRALQDQPAAVAAVPPARPAAPLDEPIAIIGMSGRFPGARNVDQFWRNLRAGVESIRRLSDDELRQSRVDSGLLSNPSYVGVGSVLDDAELFDAAFFGLNPREAETTDPQHRLFLECAHEALESAGYDPLDPAPVVGVFAGAALSSYLIHNLRGGHGSSSTVSPLQALIGNDKDFLPTRVSYKLNLRGPSVNVQTACSSSLVAVHLACRSLLEGSCDTALAGGVAVHYPQRVGYVHESGGILSPDGHCRPFDALAQGTVPGDGVGVVVLKRLSKATADGDTVLALIKGSAINNDGSGKVGFTAPSVEGQAAAIVAAHRVAGVEPRSISYVEAHGTGTPLGDPVEIAALSRAFRTGTAETGFCAISSVKANVGHLDAAAGVTGLIKTVLQLRHRQIAPTLHFAAANPAIDFAASPFVVNDRLRPWDVPAGPRRAGVSSFGMGGTNAHVVLEEAPSPAAEGPVPIWQLLTMSARTPAALARVTERLRDHLAASPAASLGDIAHTLQVGRTAHSYRRALACQDVAEAVTALTRLSSQSSSDLVKAGQGRVVFLFPGQGAQYPNMAGRLYAREPVFRDQVDRCAAVLHPHLGGCDLRATLFSSGDDAAARLRETWLTQPALFVTEYALAQLWSSWGVAPVAMIGHSVGEYVAACLSGVFSLEDALSLIAVRGRVMHEQPAGAMLAVAMSASEATALAAGRVALAAVNGPRACVLAGTFAAIDQIERDLAARGESGRRLQTSHAFHSAMMDAAVPAFARAVAEVRLHEPTVPFISNVTGTWITAAEATDPGYWVRHLRGTVDFAGGVETLLDSKHATFLEVGPGTTLGSFVRKQAAATASIAPRPTAVSSLPGRSDDVDDSEAMLTALGQLWCAGIEVYWAALHRDQRRRRVPLPTYPFERQRYVVEPDSAESTVDAMVRTQDHADWFYVPTWQRAAAPRPASGPCGAGALAARWIVIGDDAASHGLVAALRRQGLTGTVAADWPAFVSRLSESASTSPLRVLLPWRRGAAAPASVHAGFADLLVAVRAVSAHLEGRGDAELVVVTTEAFDVVGAEQIDTVQAAMVAALRVVPREYPTLHCRVIDVESAVLDANVAPGLDRLASEVAQSGGEFAIALRGAYRWRPSHQAARLEPAPARPSRLREGGVYLITGGLGGIALAVARDLATRVRAKLVLIGRTGLPDRTAWTSRIESGGEADAVSRRIRGVQAIEAAGGEVLVLTADLGVSADLRAVVAQAQARFGPVNGVIHAAGVAGGALLERQSEELSAAVFAPKVQGTETLVQLFAARPLDFFVLFSSQRSVLPAPGRADYCAANAYLDAVALSHHGTGRWPMTSILWDNWRDSGMGAIDAEAARHSVAATQARAWSLDDAEGVDAFWRILEAAPPVVVVSTRAWTEVVNENAALTATAVAASQAAARPDAAVHARPEQTAAFAAPRTATERALADIWQQLLGVDRVGIHDNFFDLGGDSVVSIQMIGRAAKSGVRLSTKQVFQHQTVAELAAAAEPGSSVAAPARAAASEGPAPLTPIQRWFFERDPSGRHHFNQAVMLRERAPVPAAVLDQALRAVVGHHAALAARFEEVDGDWRAVYQPFAERNLLQVIDCSSVADADLAEAITAHATAVQQSVDIRTGDLVRAVRFECGARPARVLLVVHHLAVDLVSWRILLEDIETVCRQQMDGRPIALGSTATSFKAWAERLAAHARQGAFATEVSDWNWLASNTLTPVPVDRAAAQTPTVGSSATVRVGLDAAATDALLHGLPRTYGTQISDAFLAALGSAFANWTGQRKVVVDMEGLGREPLFDDLETARTVGWFTTVYPVLAEWQPDRDPAAALAAARTTLRAVPSRGLGFGALRYLGPEHARPRLPQAEVCFLYIGQTGLVSPDAALFEPASESVGQSQSAQLPMTHRLTFTASIVDGALRCDVTFSTEEYDHETIGRLAAAFMRGLDDLVTAPAPRQLEAEERAMLAVAAAAEQSYPLTPMQQGMLFHTLSSPDSAEYFRHIRLTLDGPLDITGFQATWRRVANRHDILRAAIHWDGLPEPIQTITATPIEVPWTVASLAELDPESRAAELERFVAADRRQPFDLGTPPLMRCAIFACGEDRHEFIWSFHHLILDGWSFALVLQEVLADYSGSAAGALAQPATAPQFAAYLTWLAQRSLTEAEAFWRAHLRGFTVPTSAVVEPARLRGEATYVEHRVAFAPGVAGRLRSAARASRLTVNTVVQGVWAVLLSRYSGQDDVVFGAVVSGRPPDLAGVEQMVGMFINSLPVRVTLTANDSLADLFLRLQLAQAEARLFEHAPLWKIQEWSDVPRPHGLFDSLMVYENYPLSTDLSDPSQPLRVRLGSSYERTSYPLTLTVPGGDCDGVLFTYNAASFSADAIQRLAGHLESLLVAFATNPSARVAEVSMLAPAERQAIVAEWNATEVAGTTTELLPALFAHQVAAHPDRPAVVCHGQALSYAELDRQATHLAHQLRELGAGPGRLVGVCLQRSTSMLVAVLGVLKAGAGYVPLDPAYPRPRLGAMIEDAGLTLLVTETALLAEFREFRGHCLPIDGERPVIDAAAVSALPDARPDDVAYVIYTSGSTGRPKGVAVPHRALANLLQSMRREPGLIESDVLVAVTTLSFDIAGLELYLPLITGACVVVADRETAADGVRLAALLERSGATVMQATPATWRMLIDSGWAGRPALHIWCGGEALTRQLADALLVRSKSLWNLYGPTETTIWSLAERVTAGAEPILIGRPIANTTVYLLDAHGAPVPVGVPGHLHIGGVGLATGYLNRADLTDERFIANPLPERAGERIYRTGDLARYWPDGRVECLGRLDYQVKVRGHRIELGEIEAVLDAMPAVGQSVVVVRDDDPSGPRLVAYLTASGPAAPEAVELRSWLRERLPIYMLPAAYVILEHLPLTPNGKVDRRALPAPPGTDAPLEHASLQPRDEIEVALASIFARVLGRRSVGVGDSFFDLGGHSLLAVKLFTEIERVFSRALPLATLFEAPSVEQLAAVLRQQGWKAPWDSLVALQSAGDRAPFFCIHSLGSNLVSYRKLALLVGSDQPFYGLQPQGLDGSTPPNERIEEMAAHYVAEIRTVQPHGPYHLGGVCLGGIVALEMAQQLRAAGEAVAMVAMIDSYYPGQAPHLAPRAQRWSVSWVADYYLGDVLLRSPQERAIFVLTRVVNIAMRGVRLLKRAAGVFYPPLVQEGTLATALKDIHAANAKAEGHYRPQPYDGRIHLFWCSESPGRAYQDRRLGWGETAAGGLEVHVVPGNHMSMVDEPNVQVLAAKLRACLTQAQARGPVPTGEWA